MFDKAQVAVYRGVDGALSSQGGQGAVIEELLQAAYDLLVSGQLELVGEQLRC